MPIFQDLYLNTVKYFFERRKKKKLILKLGTKVKQSKQSHLIYELAINICHQIKKSGGEFTIFRMK